MAQKPAVKCENCLTNEEVDYFLICEINARYYESGFDQKCADNNRKDSIIDLQKSQINELQANERDLKESIKKGDRLTANYKYDLGYCNEKYSKTKDKANRRAGIAIGSISVNLLLGALLYFSVR